jgi:hypothetical protein
MEAGRENLAVLGGARERRGLVGRRLAGLARRPWQMARAVMLGLTTAKPHCWRGS